jgi:hypothetical protein
MSKPITGEPMTKQQEQLAQQLIDTFQDGHEVKRLIDTYVGFDPSDEDEQDFLRMLEWCLNTLRNQYCALISYHLLKADPEHENKVKNFTKKLMASHGVANRAAAEIAPPAAGTLRPKLRLIKGGS